MSTPAGDSSLSPRLAELAKPAVRSLPRALQAERLDLAPTGPGSLLREGNRVLADVRFEGGAISALDELRATGAKVLAASSRYQLVTVTVAPASLRELAEVAGVGSVSENRAPLLYGAGELPSAAALGAECEGGAVISEGIAQLGVADARGKYGLDGSGITVGVLSDSFDRATAAADESGPVATHASEDVESGDLTGPANTCSGQGTQVNVLDDSATGFEPTDEGRGMAQIVHDVAPEASLAFATAFRSELSFAQNIEGLAKPVGEGGAGAEVIVDDVAWFEEPFFQDGPIAAAVNKVVSEGVAYFSAAGNNNLFEGSNEIASWEAPSFRDSSTCPASLLALPGFGAGHCMDFNPAGGSDDTFGITVSPGATLTVDLQWAEPWFGVQADLDAFLLDAEGQPIAQEDSDNVGDTQRPVEVLQWENTAATSKKVQLAVNRCGPPTCNPVASGAATPRLKLALLENGAGVTKTEYPASAEGDTVGPTIFGHSGTAGAVSVAAIPYTSDTQPEKYSSRGPVTHYFGPVDGIVPAAPLGSAETIAKPDITATDCGATTFFAFFVEEEKEDTWRFCGTSAAAPHAAGVAALELEAEQAASVEEVRDAQTTTASSIGVFGPNAVGAGLLNADAAIASLLPPSAVTLTGHPSIRTADSTPSFSFEASDPTEFACSIDGGPPQEPCSSPFTVTEPLADGSHTFEVEALDIVGSASFSFTVDTAPPAISFTTQPPAISANAHPVFAFHASEPAIFACSLDGATPLTCSSPFSPANTLADGSHTFEVMATDQVGNSGDAAVGFTVQTPPAPVDTVAPVVTFTERPPPRSAERLPRFVFAASEPAAFSCAIDARTPQPCDSPFVAPQPLTDGSHTFAVTATDPAGNAGRATTGFAIDARPPQTFFAEHPPSVLRTRQATARASFRVRSNESKVSFVCKVDRGLPRFCGSRFSRRFAVGGHTIQVRARDAVGNVDRTPAVFHFRVKRLG